MPSNAQRAATADYLRKFAAQTTAIGRQAQLRLRDTHVLVIGAGGLGSTTCLTLAGVGIGRITAVDPQTMAPDNFNRHVLARDSDVGVYTKVSVLSRALKTRSHHRFKGLAVSCDDESVRRWTANADILLSASNTVHSRLVAARLARQFKTPHVFAGVDDARFALGGTVGVWIPERNDLACQGCYLVGARESGRHGALVTTPIAVVSGLAAHLIVRVVATAQPEQMIAGSNLFTLNLDAWQLHATLIRKHPQCGICQARAE